MKCGSCGNAGGPAGRDLNSLRMLVSLLTAFSLLHARIKHKFSANYQQRQVSA